MTIDEIKARVERIKACGGDYEAAHSEEDKLHQDVLRAIRDGECEDPDACAAEALKTLELDFIRYCA